MAVSLHTAVVGTWLQLLPQVAHLVDKAEAHCREQGLTAQELTGARLADDMWPFAKQVAETAHHSARALSGVRAGVFGPEIDPVPDDFAWLRAEVAGAIALLESVDPGELDAIADRDMRFEFGKFRRDFTVSDFLLTFSLPNFHFHTTTAYAILRHAGVKIGKLDYLGRMRTKS
jgi:hypothetical protein